ncbi:MAG TPA: FkbM family methyltransferase [Acidobacteriaceae bacterium]|nr:FkbM family methyltransferase [Acidobacteriaceae bacterium]
MPVLPRIKSVLYESPVYPVARSCYEAIFKGSTLREMNKMRRFYGQFFRPGEIVFDIGANVGEYSEVFASCGATVVAVEPQPACCQSLYKLARRAGVRVEPCAVGATTGVAQMHICDINVFSTLNPEWVTCTEGFPSYQNAHWTETIDVPVVTVDNLVKRHGKPTFVKIDVEGFEDKVLEGMSFLPKFVSFEFNARLTHIALRCLSMARMKKYRFNSIAGRKLEWHHLQWMSNDDAKIWLSHYHDEAEYGDLFGQLVVA